MDILTVVLLGIGLAMDAFAISLCKGLAIGKVKFRAILAIGAWFGFFHFLMPVIGFYVGKSFHEYIDNYDYWFAFVILFILGANMIREALMGEEDEIDGSTDFKIMLLLALAVSIDSLAVGLSMAMSGESIFVPAAIIGVITALISMSGVKIGSIFGNLLGNKACICGGAVLIIIAFKLLLEGLGVF